MPACAASPARTASASWAATSRPSAPTSPSAPPPTPGRPRRRSVPSHIQTKRADLSFGTILDPAEYDEATAVDLELDAGQMVLFDVFTIHGARHNLGTLERTGFAMRYMPATSHYDHDSAPDYSKNSPEFGHDTRPLMLVRGVDACGRNDFRRGHPAEDARA